MQEHSVALSLALDRSADGPPARRDVRSNNDEGDDEGDDEGGDEGGGGGEDNRGTEVRASEVATTELRRHRAALAEVEALLAR